MNRTIIIVNDFDYIDGGASKVAIDTCRILHNFGEKVILFCGYSKGVDYPFEVICTNQKPITESKNVFLNLYNRKSYRLLKKIILINDNPIVHIHTWTKVLSSSVFKVCYDLNIKNVLTCHDYFSSCPNGGFFNYKINRICDFKPNSTNCKLSNCDSRSYFHKIYRILRFNIQNKYVKIQKNQRNIIYISDFSKNIISKYFTISTFFKLLNPIKIGAYDNDYNNYNNSYIYIGRLDKEKGVELLCDSIGDNRIDIIGDGTELKKLKKKYIEKENISFLGWLNHGEAMGRLKRAKALIFPSLWYEGAPLTIFEAMSLGIPCIISNVSAGTDFVEDKISGQIYNPYKKIEIEQILKNISNKDLLKFSKNSKKLFKNYNLSQKYYYEELIIIYKKILKQV